MPDTINIQQNKITMVDLGSVFTLPAAYLLVNLIFVICVRYY